MTSYQALHQIRNIVLLFCFALFLVACEKEQQTETIAIPQLNDGNIKSFARTLAQDYLSLEVLLISTFNTHKKANDAFGFTQFRNQKWTPAYIEKKEYYQTVLKQNKAYLSDHSVAPLFGAFENLIYTGINLKNALLNEDLALEEEALASSEQDKQSVMAIIKAIK